MRVTSLAPGHAGEGCGLEEGAFIGDGMIARSRIGRSSNLRDPTPTGSALNFPGAGTVQHRSRFVRKRTEGALCRIRTPSATASWRGNANNGPRKRAIRRRGAPTRNSRANGGSWPIRSKRRAASYRSRANAGCACKVAVRLRTYGTVRASAGTVAIIQRTRPDALFLGLRCARRSVAISSGRRRLGDLVELLPFFHGSKRNGHCSTQPAARASSPR